MMEEKEGQRGRISRKDLRRMRMFASWSVEDFHCPSIFKTGLPDLEKSKPELV